MTPSMRLTLFATGALAIASVIGFASRGVAQDGSVAGTIRLAEKKDHGPKGGPRGGAPKTIAPRTFTSPKTHVAPKGPTPRVGTQTVSPRVVGPTVGPRVSGPRTVGPGGPGLRAIGPRSAGAVYVGGRNYSVWRGSHRVRYGAGWATLAALGALGVIVYGGANYYPYAYISATGPYCEGATEDGCVLQWQEVPTLEGPSLLQCVAYCPWQ